MLEIRSDLSFDLKHSRFAAYLPTALARKIMESVMSFSSFVSALSFEPTDLILTLILFTCMGCEHSSL